MDRGCQTIQEAVVETSGDLDRLPTADRRHIDECAQCSLLAASERRLGLLLEQAVPPADPELERQIILALGPAPRRRRVVACVPVAASFLVAFLGAVMVGGVPGGSLLGMLPRWSGQGWLALTTAASDWGWALFATSRVTEAVLPPVLHVLAVLLTASGVAALCGMTRRWRRALLWHRDV